MLPSPPAGGNSRRQGPAARFEALKQLGGLCFTRDNCQAGAGRPLLFAERWRSGAMAERPEGAFRRPQPEELAARPERAEESWPAPGDTQRIAPPPAEPPRQPSARRPLPPLPPLPQVPQLPVMPLAPAGFGFRPQTEPSAILALVVAVLAWVACPILAAIAALMIAGGAKAKIDVAGGALTGLGLVSAARWIAWIHLCIVPIGFVLVLIGYDVFGNVLS
jgi:hypothetical protein